MSFYENGNLIDDFSLETKSISDNEFHKFEFDNGITVGKNSVYTVTIEERYKGDNSIAIYTDETSGSLCCKYVYRNNSKKTIVLCVCILMMIITFFCIIKKYSDKLIMSFVLGGLMIMYICIIPSGKAPDERAHFYRAYEIANISMISEHIGETGEGGNYLPVNIDKWEDKNARLDTNQLEPIKFGNMSLYAPISYLPQSIGIKIACCFTDNVSSIFFGGRLSNALFSFILCVFALYLIPFGERVLFVIMTFPMTLQELVSLSPDGLTVSLSIFFLAYVLKCANSTTQIKRKDIIVLFVSGIILSLCKIVYVIILPAIIIIPLDIYKTKKIGKIVRCGLIASGLLFNFVWLKIASGFLVEFNKGVDSGKQVLYILKSPFSYCRVILNTLKESPLWLKRMIGESLGSYNVLISAMVWIGLLVILIYELENTEVNKLRIKKNRFVLFVSLFIVGVVLIMTSLYVQWTPYSYSEIFGVQGRYFTPILGLLFIPMIIYKNKKAQRCMYYCALFILFLNIIALVDVCSVYK